MEPPKVDDVSADWLCLSSLGDDGELQMHMDASAAIGIIERKGLCKMRHLDLNNLWIQEQQARMAIPTEKVGGTNNIADLMTKHVSAAEIDKYITMMSQEFREGRAEKTVGLHVLEGKRKGDSWDCRGAGGRWIRRHDSWRNTLFTPFKVATGPNKDVTMNIWRRTQGLSKGEGRFTMTDKWQEHQNSHRRTAREWRGRTTCWEEDADKGLVLNDGDHDTTTMTATVNDDDRRATQHGTPYCADSVEDPIRTPGDVPRASVRRASREDRIHGQSKLARTPNRA